MMRSSLRPPLWLGFPLLACLGAGCTEPGDAEAEGAFRLERSVINGIEVARTVGAVDATAVLQEDLRLGKLEGEEHEAFSAISLVSPFPDGSFAGVDRQALRIHIYGDAGDHITSFGSRGEGPGEFQDVGGVTLQADGTLAVHDSRLGRVSIFSREGQFLQSRMVPGGLFASSNLLSASSTDGFLLRVHIRTPEMPRGEFLPALVRFSGDSASQGDTLLAPIETPDPAYSLIASNGGRTTSGTVPFAPQPLWAWHPDGYWVTGTGRDYQVFLINEAGDTLRIIEREVESAPVTAEEASERRACMIASMTGVQPDWRWTGSEIPDRKPFFRDLTVSADGRIWVLRHVQAQRNEINEEALADVPPARRPYEWVEPVVYDVFEADGRFLGEVPVPKGFYLLSAYRNSLWSMEVSPEGIPQLVRYKIGFAQTGA